MEIEKGPVDLFPTEPTDEATENKKDPNDFSFESFCFQCGRWDLNPHVYTNTRSLVLPVCQFQHFRMCASISRDDLVIITNVFTYVNNFFEKFYFFTNKFFRTLLQALACHNNSPESYPRSCLLRLLTACAALLLPHKQLHRWFSLIRKPS